MTDIDELVQIADEWRRKDNPDWERNVRGSLVSKSLRQAVRLKAAEGPRWLVAIDSVDTLGRLVALGPLTKVKSDNCDAADLAVHIGRPDLARTLLEQSAPQYTGHGPIWVEYEAARIALLDGKPYSAPAGPIKAKGLLSTFVPYLALAEALSKGEDITAALADVDAAVRRRNSDKRMSSTTMIDGDGQIPAKWDLRRAVLLILGGRDPVTAEPVP